MVVSTYETAPQLYPLGVLVGTSISVLVLCIMAVFLWRKHQERKRFLQQFSDKPFDWLCVARNEIIIIYIEPYARIDIDELDRNTPLYRTIKRYEQAIHTAFVNQKWKQLRRIKPQMNREIAYFDRVCCLDAPDLVKAKVWSCL